MSDLLEDLSDTEREILEILAPLYAEVRHWERELADARKAKRVVAIAMEARQGRDPKGLDGEAATARAEGIAHNPSSTPRDERE
jgi:hypothetical protein